jgi:hypothetical protein
MARKNDEESVWQGKYKDLKAYYKASYNEEYYYLTQYEYEIDPDETMDEINSYDENRQRLEYAKCALDFFYFAHKYIKILHPKRGLVPFICYKYQHKVIGDYEKYRFTMLSKFRQAGLTTLTELWGMWRCMFKLDQQIVLISKTDAEAVKAGEIIDRAKEHLPKWMQPSPLGKWNDHKKEFHETGGCVSFYSPERARGLAITYLIVDEAAFIPEMDKHWKAIYPTLSAGGNCIIVSTVNGLGNWYEKAYHRSQRSGKPFHLIDLDYVQHPEYNDPKWVADQKSQLGQKGWMQEVLRSFLGSGETYIPTEVMSELVLSTRNNIPKRKLFKNWVNTKIEEEDQLLGAEDEEVVDVSWQNEGAMWIWQERKEGHEYTVGVDTAEGVGEDGDNSCIQIFDNGNLEQVAEFYSNSIPPYQLAQIVNEIAIYYNHALVVVESNGSGGAVISNLQHQLFYDNLYYDGASKNKNPKAGIKVGVANRLTILESLQQKCINRTIKLNSMRLVKELTTLVHHPQTQKIAAVKGEHDDSIMAACMALFIHDTTTREMPIGPSITNHKVEPMKAVDYEKIKKEIMEGVSEDDDILELRSSAFSLDEENAGVAFDFRRKNETLIKEFGW